jgi:DNA-binding response OmpR family regulator
VIPEPDAYLEKPPEAQEVLAVVQKLIRGAPEAEAAKL